MSNGTTAGSVLLLGRSGGSPTDKPAAPPADLAESLADHGWTVTLIPGGTQGTGGFGALFRAPRPDVVILTMDRPLLGLAALALARIRRSRVILWIRLRATDAKANGTASPAAHHAAGPNRSVLPWPGRVMARWSHVLVSPGQRMAELLAAAGTPTDRLVCIPDWTDTLGNRPVAAESNPFRAAHGLEQAFIILCHGGLGHRRACGTLIDAAWLLKDQGHIVFLFIGNGAERAPLEADAWRFGLDNIRFLDPLQEGSLAQALSAANASLVMENPTRGGLRVPDQVSRSIASGCPLLLVGAQESETARLVAATHCGITVPGEDSESLANAVLHLMEQPEEAALMGTMARFAAVTLYDRRIVTTHWHELLTRVVGDAVSESAGPRPKGSRRSRRGGGTGAVALDGWRA